LLNGTKNWITNGSSASNLFSYHQTDIDKATAKGIKRVYSRKKVGHSDIGPKERKMGIRGRIRVL
jgi:alkylation response protein AidB-like acyl-CoA dehydrogenase